MCEKRKFKCRKKSLILIFILSILFVFLLGALLGINCHKKCPDKPQPPAVECKLIKGVGTLVAYVDAHSVIIKMDCKDTSFQAYEPIMNEMMGKISENDDICFLYAIDEHNQNVLQYVEKLNRTMITKQGIFVGIGDPHTVYISVDNAETAFQADPNLVGEIDKTIKTGDQVSFTYYVNLCNQNVLVEIHKITAPKTGDTGVIPYAGLAAVSLGALIISKRIAANKINQ